MHTDAQRRHLFDQLGEVLTPESRDVLMELLPPVGWSDIARQADIRELRGEMAELRAALRGEMAELRADLAGEIAELRTEVHGQLPKLITANIASMICVAGLVLGAAQLG